MRIDNKVLGMKARLLRKLRRRAFKGVKLEYVYGRYYIVWKQRFMEELKWNVEKGLFLYGDYTLFSECEHSEEELRWFLWKAREKAVRNMFEEYKEKAINREMKKI